VNPLLNASIRQALLARPGPPIDYFAEYLEAEHFGMAEASAALAASIRLKYRGRPTDVVIAWTDASLQFVLDHRADLFPDAAIVFGGLRPPDEATRTSGAGVAAVLVGAAYGETLKVALDLHPLTQRVFVVARSPDAANVATVHAALDVFAHRAQLTYLAPPTVDGLIDEVRRIPARSLVLFVWYQLDAPDDMMASDEIARLVAGAAPVPVYGTSDFYLDAGVVGGVVRGTADTGARLGRIARDILDGGRAQDVPVEYARLVPTFDGRQLARWGISERRLPPGSVVLSRPPSLWRDYRGTVLSVLGVGALQLGLILGLLYQRRERRHAELATRQHLTITAHLERQLAMGEMAAAFAHELNQPLGAIRFNVEAADRLLAANRASVDDLREILRDIKDEDARVSRIIERQRALLRRRDIEWRTLDANDVVREGLAAVSRVAADRRVRVSPEPCGEPCPVIGDPILLQQVIVNLATNAIDAMDRTALPDRWLIVGIRADRHLVEVSVEDRGEGIAPDVAARLFDPFVTTKATGMGIGLTIVRGIVEAHGGTIRARNNAAGRGATFSFTLPLSQAGPGRDDVPIPA
jgi:signal transduction histidine kinase